MQVNEANTLEQITARLDRCIERAAPLLMSMGWMALAALGFAYRDFALQWQPVPAGWPQRQLLALICAVWLLAGGIGLLLPAIRRRAAVTTSFFFFLSAFALHGPLVLAAPAVVARWNGFAENLAVALGALLLGLVWRGSRFDASRCLRPPLRGFAACLCVFGTAHFVYADFTANMVPAWLPWRLAIAYATGAVHLISGIALLTRWRAAAWLRLETLMMSSFVALLHLPGVAQQPRDRLQWTMLAMALCLTASSGIAALSAGAGAAFPRRDGPALKPQPNHAVNGSIR